MDFTGLMTNDKVKLTIQFVEATMKRGIHNQKQRNVEKGAYITFASRDCIITKLPYIYD
jgi:hypothetical protein